ncbi:MAG: hypothetical protein KatS3mg060_0053 [Dehalococcoidia bacterium]|jgi:hypothetical protein|nr:MAG: hypothetical protein KatS3mg060_0053 [Dehalococcoidia bacterium]
MPDRGCHAALLWLAAGLLTAALTAGLALAVRPAEALPTGVRSAGLWQGQGCFCHGDPGYAGTVILSPTIVAPLTVPANSAISITVSLTGTTDQPGPLGLGGGLDLAASRGTLVPGPTTRYVDNSRELTHLTRTFTSWTVGWVAPSTNGPVQLSAALLLANGDGVNTFDHWTIVSRTLVVVGGMEQSFVPAAPMNAGP